MQNNSFSYKNMQQFVDFIDKRIENKLLMSSQVQYIKPYPAKVVSVSDDGLTADCQILIVNDSTILHGLKNKTNTILNVNDEVEICAINNDLTNCYIGVNKFGSTVDGKNINTVDQIKISNIRPLTITRNTKSLNPLQLYNFSNSGNDIFNENEIIKVDTGGVLDNYTANSYLQALQILDDTITSFDLTQDRVTNAEGRISEAEIKLTPYAISNTVSTSIMGSSNPIFAVDNTNRGITYEGIWNTENISACHNGIGKYSNFTNNNIQCTSIGTGLNLYFIQSEHMGKVEVFINDVSKGVIDLYKAPLDFTISTTQINDNMSTSQYTTSKTLNDISNKTLDEISSLTWNQIVTKNLKLSISNLEYSSYTFEINVTGTKNSSSDNTYVEFDYFEILNSMAVDNTNVGSIIRQSPTDVQVAFNGINPDISNSGGTFGILNGKLIVKNSNGIVTIDGSKQVMQIVASGNINVNCPIGQTSTSASITHGLGYRPTFITYQDDSSTGKSSMTPNMIIDYSTSSSTIGITSMCTSTCDTTNLTVNVFRAQDRANIKAETITFHYYIFQTTAF